MRCAARVHSGRNTGRPHRATGRTAYGYGLFTGGFGAHYDAEASGCTVIPVSGGMTERKVLLIRDLEPDIIMVTPSCILAILDEMEPGSARCAPNRRRAAARIADQTRSVQVRGHLPPNPPKRFARAAFPPSVLVVAQEHAVPEQRGEATGGGRVMRRHARTSGWAALAAAVAALVGAGLSGPPANAVNAVQDGVVSADPVNYTPHVMNGAVIAITQVGNKVIAGGTFTTVRQTLNGPDITRNRIFAFDATTGAIDMAFNPNLGGAVNSLDTDGTYIYVGGAFGSIGGNTAIRKLVKLTVTGEVVPGLRRPNGNVNDVVVRGSRLYVGGAFTSFNKPATARLRLAALDKETGAVLPEVDVPFTGVYDPAIGGATNVKRFDVSPDGSKLVAVGNFNTVAGLTRSQVVVLDLPPTGPATVSSWATNRFDEAHNNCAGVFDTFVRDVDVSPDGSYFVVSTTGAFAGGSRTATMCDTTSRWEFASTGNDPTWIDYTGGDTTYGVAVTGTAVYVGGHFRWENNPFQSGQAGPGAVPRSGIAALDPYNGLPLTWNPGRARGVGAQGTFATSQGLWVGSDTSNIGGEVHRRIAFLPLSAGTSVPAVAPATLPNTLFLVERASPGRLLRQPVSDTGVPSGAPTVANSDIDWSQLRGAFLLNGTLYYGLADGRLYARSFDPTSGAIGQQRTVDLRDDPDDGSRIPFSISGLTGIFFDAATHRLYYTVSGDRNLYYRYFTPESEVVGAQTFTASSAGQNMSSVLGMTLAGGRVLYGASDGALRSIAFANGVFTGLPSVLSSDGTWRYRAIVVPN